jgi:hypothetical protein
MWKRGKESSKWREQQNKNIKHRCGRVILIIIELLILRFRSG